MPRTYEPHPYRESDRDPVACWTCGFGPAHEIHNMGKYWREWTLKRDAELHPRPGPPAFIHGVIGGIGASLIWAAYVLLT